MTLLTVPRPRTTVVQQLGPVRETPQPELARDGGLCGLMSSMVFYVSDLLALRRVPAQMFSTFTIINPLWAALAG